MTSVTLIHPEQTLTVPIRQMITKSSLFQNNPALLATPYQVQSTIPLSIFQQFVSAFENNRVDITDTNFTGLQLLCEEFGFDELSAKLSKFFQPLKGPQRCQIESSLTRMRSSLLSESFQFVVNQSVIEISLAESLIFPAVREQLSVDGCARSFFLENSGIEAADIHSLQLLLSGETILVKRSQGLLSGFLGNVSFERLLLGCSKAGIRMNLSDLVMERRIDLGGLSVEALDSLLLDEFVTVESEDALLRFILNLGLDYRDLVRHIQIGFLSEDGLSLLVEHFGIPPESIWQCAAEQIAHPPSLIDSQIISDFPEIFAEFRGRRFSLLWRGSRDGFGASGFHERCDGHENTLTVILDTKGNIFGGFTPVKWDSNSEAMTDDSLKSFLFTLKNPHNIPARKFALKAEFKHQAINRAFGYGPLFGDDIGVFTDCNKNLSFTSLHLVYSNDTGLDPDIVFTGSFNFQVTEIEVFEITE
jgi:hypothetical protein